MKLKFLLTFLQGDFKPTHIHLKKLHYEKWYVMMMPFYLKTETSRVKTCNFM